MSKYFIEAKIDGVWCDAFLIDGAFKTGMSSNADDYRITEVTK